jgi:hypothetical protein
LKDSNKQDYIKEQHDNDQNVDIRDRHVRTCCDRGHGKSGYKVYTCFLSQQFVKLVAGVFERLGNVRNGIKQQKLAHAGNMSEESACGDS